MSARPASPAPKTRPPRLWLRVLTPNGGRIGPGMVALLKAVAVEGSITAAAKSLDMSYRRAWLLLDSAGQALGAPVVETSIGGRDKGGARLSEAGARLIALYDRLESEANAQAEAALSEFFEGVSAPASPS